jgi:hypothetical protein
MSHTCLLFLFNLQRKASSISQRRNFVLSKSHKFRMWHILAWAVILFTVGCHKNQIDVPEPSLTAECKVLSYEPISSNGGYLLPVAFKYDDQGLLMASTNPFIPDYTCLWKSDADGRPLEASGEVSFSSYKNVPYIKYTHGDKGIKVIEIYTYYFDLNSINEPIKTLNKITRLTFEYGTSDKPESMLYMFWDDSVGIEGKPDALKKYDYQYDNHGNLIAERYWEEKEGQMVLMQSKNHFYDSQLNSMDQIHLLSYNPHYSAPFVFSKNNLIKTETTVGPQYSFIDSYKLKYDENGTVTEDGRWYRNIKRDCK